MDVEFPDSSSIAEMKREETDKVRLWIVNMTLWFFVSLLRKSLRMKMRPESTIHTLWKILAAKVRGRNVHPNMSCECGSSSFSRWNRKKDAQHTLGTVYTLMTAQVEEAEDDLHLF